MRNAIYIVLILGAAFGVTTSFSVGELMPPTSQQERDRLKGFAEMSATHCEWKVPSIFAFLVAGRPPLQPNAVCINHRQNHDTSISAKAYGENLRTNIGPVLEHFFKGQTTIVGLAMAGPDAPLVCYFPEAPDSWRLCKPAKSQGCLFATCEPL